MPSENETNTNRPTDAEAWDLLYRLVKLLADDIKDGCRPLLVLGIPKDVMEAFERTIMSRSKYQGQESGDARNSEIRKFIFETIGRPVKKE